MEALFRLSEERVQLTVGLLIDVASNSRHGADVLKIIINKRLPEVRITEEMVNAAEKDYESRLEVISILIQDERVEMRGFERALEVFDMNTARPFLQKRVSGIEVSENMLVYAAGNFRSGAEITEFLIASEPTILITGTIMESAAKNPEQGPEVVQVFYRRGLSIETITTQMLFMATRYWRKGERVMRMLLQDKKTRKIPRDVLYAAASNHFCGGKMMEAFFMERRTEFLEKVMRASFDHETLVQVARFKTSGAEVMQLLLEVNPSCCTITTRVIESVIDNKHGANMMRVLLRKRKKEVLRLLTTKMKTHAQVRWGFNTDELFSGKEDAELNWGLDISG